MSLDNQTDLQVKGIVRFIMSTGAQDVKLLGSVDLPMSSNDLMRTLIGYKEGTMFAILIGASEANSHFIGGAHWIGCLRNAGSPALNFVDYQLDTEMDTRQLHRFGKVPNSAPLGNPYERSVPTRPWAIRTDTATDHYVAITFARK